jgi:thiamine kinase-like enzyme
MEEWIERILARVPGWNLRDLTVTPMEGGITNQNYRVEFQGEAFVLRIGGEGTHLLGIDRRNEFVATSEAARLGIGPEVLCFFEEEAAMVTRFIQGAAITLEAAARPERLRRIIDSIRRYHGGPPFPAKFSPFDTVRNYHRLALERDVTFPPEAQHALKLMDHIEKALGSVRRPVPCHNDLLAGNFIDDGVTVRILDWEYAGMGDLFFDLGNFAANQLLGKKEEELLLQHYFSALRPRDEAHLSLMRLMSDLRESFWGFLQCGVSKLDFDYRKYAQGHLDRLLKNAASPDFPAWLKSVRST